MSNPLFPTALYKHKGLAADQHLTQDEWNQVGAEVQSIEAILNAVLGNPAGEPGGDDVDFPFGFSEIAWGKTAIKGRLLDIAAAADLQIRTNWKEDGTADDALQSGWMVRLGVQVDEASVHRREPGAGTAVETELIRQTADSLYLNSNVGIKVTDPHEALDVFGGIRMAAALGTLPGTIQYTADGRFQGRNASGWVYLDVTDVAGGSGLPTTGVTEGDYGDETHLVTFHVDPDGRISFAASIDLSEAGVVPGGPAGGSLVGYYPDPTLSLTGVTPGTYGGITTIASVTVTAEGRVSAATSIPFSGTGGFSIPTIPHVLNTSGEDSIAATSNKQLQIITITALVDGDMIISGSVQGRIHIPNDPGWTGMHQTWLTFRVRVNGAEVQKLQRGPIFTFISDTYITQSTQIEIPFIAWANIALGSNYDVSIDCSNTRDPDETSDSHPTYPMVFDIDFTQLLIEQIKGPEALMSAVLTVNEEGRITAASQVVIEPMAVGDSGWREETTEIHTVNPDLPVRISQTPIAPVYGITGGTFETLSLGAKLQVIDRKYPWSLITLVGSGDGIAISGDPADTSAQGLTGLRLANLFYYHAGMSDEELSFSCDYRLGVGVGDQIFRLRKIYPGFDSRELFQVSASGNMYLGPSEELQYTSGGSNIGNALANFRVVTCTRDGLDFQTDFGASTVGAFQIATGYMAGRPYGDSGGGAKRGHRLHGGGAIDLAAGTVGLDLKYGTLQLFTWSSGTVVWSQAFWQFECDIYFYNTNELRWVARLELVTTPGTSPAMTGVANTFVTRGHQSVTGSGPISYVLSGTFSASNALNKITKDLFEIDLY